MKMKQFFKSLKNALIALCLFMFLHVKTVVLTLHMDFKDNFMRPFDGILKSRKRVRRLRMRRIKIIFLKIQRWFRLKVGKVKKRFPGFNSVKKIHHPRGQPFFRNFVLNRKPNVETRDLTEHEKVKLKEKEKKIRTVFHKKYCA